jgi:hypothetical protein
VSNSILLAFFSKHFTCWDGDGKNDKRVVERGREVGKKKNSC